MMLQPVEYLPFTRQALVGYRPPRSGMRVFDAEEADTGRPVILACCCDLLVMEQLRLGFFGQYRREKNLDILLRAFTEGEYRRPVRLIVQGSTQTPEDAEDFQRLIGLYAGWQDDRGQASLEFWHRPLIGPDWQKGLASCDALVIPYGSPRYLYHTSALISNALGYGKAVLAADDVNPEVLAEYRIGLSFPSGDPAALQRALEEFVNTYAERQDLYGEGLARAYADFSPRRLAENVVALAEGCYSRPHL